MNAGEINVCIEHEKEIRKLREEKAELQRRIDKAMVAAKNGMIMYFVIAALEGHK